MARTQLCAARVGTTSYRTGAGGGAGSESPQAAGGGRSSHIEKGIVDVLADRIDLPSDASKRRRDSSWLRDTGSSLSIRPADDVRWSEL